MSKEKQQILETLEKLPEEVAVQVINYMEYLTFIYESKMAPEELIIKDKEDLAKKLQEGIEDINQGNVCSLEEAFKEVQEVLNN